MTTIHDSFRAIPYMGVIYVLDEAMKLGFRLGDTSWSNLGQGQPEVGEMDGAPPRIMSIGLEAADHAYGPINGTDEARETVAAYYNRVYRKDHASKYTKDNVSLACGGRLMLTRIFAALGDIAYGYKVPDYTAYEDLMNYHRHRNRPVLIPTSEDTGFDVTPEALEGAVSQHGLGAFLVSNPCNPTGMVISGDALAAYVRIGREHGCTMLLDEFYSHFIYGDGGGPGDGPVSSAAYVEDVNEDPVVIVDGLTKCHRYPGWRLGWALGPEEVIETLGRAASAIDGGPSRVLQRAMHEALEPARADQETTALRTVFAKKRDVMVASLQRMGMRLPRPTESTFYTWACLEGLPAPLNTAEGFFREALKRQVITVPGPAFDVRPGDPDTRPPSEFEQWMRFSFGPPMDNLVQGLERLETMVAEARNDH